MSSYYDPTNYRILDLKNDGYKATDLQNLSVLSGGAYLNRFRDFSRMEDLEHSVQCYRKALLLRPSKNTLRFNSLNHLAAAIARRFEYTGRREDLQDTIHYGYEALLLCPSDNPNRAAALYGLGIAIVKKFDLLATVGDLEEAVRLFRESLDLRPSGNPERFISLTALGDAMIKHYEHGRRIECLDEAIAYYHEALPLFPIDHSHLIAAANSLSIAVVMHYDQIGEMVDLDEAVSSFRKIFSHLPDGTSDDYRIATLKNLIGAISRRFEKEGRTEDLEEIISLNRVSLSLHPQEHPDRPTSLIELGTALVRRFEFCRNLNDLTESIDYYREGVILAPPGNDSHFSALGSLALALMKLFEQTSCLEDLDEAIQYHRDTLSLRSPGNSWHAICLGHLADALFIRFQHSGQIEDLNEASRRCCDAQAEFPKEHPVHTRIRALLASIHLRQYDLSPSTQLLTKAFELFESSVTHSPAGVKARFTAALDWVSAARRHKHKSVLSAYISTLSLLHRYVVQSSTEQQKLIACTVNIPKTLASDAASHAIETGKLDTAIELLELGRNLIWKNVRGYRPPLQELRQTQEGNDLADEFGRISHQLEHLAKSFDSEQVVGEVVAVPFDQKHQKHLMLSKKWENVVDRIRQLEGFADFLKVVPFSALRKAAAEGPIIIVNISDHRSDAIIVRESDLPVLVPLPKASPDVFALIASQLSNPDFSKAPDFSMKLRPILRNLWELIVSPVVDKLTMLSVAKKTRIWWCPTSHLLALPLHAAGTYTVNQKPLPDIYISSYTPTLATLIAARTIGARSSLPRMLVIGQQEPFPRVAEEIRIIEQLGNSMDAVVGKGAHTVFDALDRLLSHSWAHFACDGHRHSQPFDSSFELHAGERLALSDLIDARLPNAELAFLSTCHVSAPDIQEAAEEVIHLAVALPFCGFRSVIGTMWDAADIDAPQVTQDFYRHIFRESGEVADFKESAMALNFATKEMRKRKLPLGRWVNFIHIGA